MDQLTQEQSEQCARACGWIEVASKRYKGILVDPGGWNDRDGKRVVDTTIRNMNYSDPYFWFPRLVERLREEFARTGISPVTLREAVGVPSIWLDYMDGTIDMVECSMRLCAAIEALEKETGIGRRLSE